MELVKQIVKKHLKKLLTEQHIRFLTPSGCGPGRLYGTTKVHKSGKPVRPIVSMVNTPEYRLAKYLDNIIKPFIPAKYSITSNTDFMHKLKDLELHEGDYCISFDIVSLFTNVPLDETISIVANAMHDQPVSKPSLIALLKRATGGIFTHRNQLYVQEDGVAMGNPLAPTLANFLLGHLESGLFQDNNTCDQPAFYTRYVDDIFCVFRKDCDYRPFQDRLNALHSNLKFTHEMGGTSMPFLDTRITLKPGGIHSSVYRKPTNTNVVLNNTAVAPSIWKSGLIKCLLKRAQVVCSDDLALAEEHRKLKEIFYQNGYPYHRFDSIKQKFDGKIANCRHDSSSHQVGEPEDRKIVFSVPYLGKISITFAKRLRNLLSSGGQDIRIIYKTTKIQDSFILKDPVPKAISSKVVYKFTCRSDPATNYIGFTNRTLSERVKEHVRGSTAVSEHIAACVKCNGDGITMDDFSIIKRCRYKGESSIYEALAIKEQNPILNKNLIKPGKTFNLNLFN